MAVIIEGEQRFLVIDLRLTKTLGYEPTDNELREFMVIPEGAKLLVRMTDGSIVELQAHKGARAKSRPAEAHSQSYEGAPYKLRYAIHSSVDIRYLLDADKTTALTAQSATHVRLSTASKDFDLNVRRRPFGNFRRAINCVHSDQLPAPT